MLHTSSNFKEVEVEEANGKLNSIETLQNGLGFWDYAKGCAAAAFP